MTNAPTNERRARQETAVKIVSCYHQRSPTLEIHDPQLTELPACIGLLGHLSALDLSGSTALKALPNVLHNFQHLQTLNLRDCQSLAQLPATVTAMRWFTNVILLNSGVKLADPLGGANTSSPSRFNK
ncbi:MAG TPA: hypothetical protein VFX23_10125 [Limnobacter sp.]|nr:hypothetical protein [Limnobacter sp.]